MLLLDVELLSQNFKCWFFGYYYLKTLGVHILKKTVYVAFCFRNSESPSIQLFSWLQTFEHY
jgi:hypothetical protein